MTTTSVMPSRFALVFFVLMGLPATGSAQPTYKLDVKPHLKPLSTLTLDKGMVVRTELSDDPGFRLQYHFKSANGKTLTVVQARGKLRVPLPAGPAGEYRVVLELFYPAYKGGMASKGEFKPVSRELSYRLPQQSSVVSSQ